MDTATTERVSREQVLEAISDVVAQQAQVARCEASLAAARRRLGDLVSRLSRLQRASDDALPPEAASALEGIALEDGGDPGQGEVTACAADERAGTLRERIVAVMEATPCEVYTPARLAPAVGSVNRDSVRNTLLVLAAKGRILKVGAGQYRARSA